MYKLHWFCENHKVVVLHLFFSARLGKILREVPHSTNSVLLAWIINTRCMPHAVMCASDVCFFHSKSKGVKAGMMISDSRENIPRPGRVHGK